MGGPLCPFISGPVMIGEGDPALLEVVCQRERCAAWHRPRSPMLGGDPYLPGYCFLIGRPE